MFYNTIHTYTLYIVTCIFGYSFMMYFLSLFSDLKIFTQRNVLFVPLCRRAGGKAAFSSSSCVLLDSDCEEELIKKVSVSRKRRLSSCLSEHDGHLEEVSACFIQGPNVFHCLY